MVPGTKPFLLALAMLANLAPAHAQSASDQAEVLFRQGRDLAAAKKYPEACAAFEASQKLDPAVTTLLNLADCREKNGQLASALAEFSNAEKLARAAGGPNGEKFAKVAGDRSAKLQPRISKLTISVANDRRIAGLAVMRDGVAVDSVTWNVPLPIDGGTYEVSARAPGHEPWTTKVTVKPSEDAQTVEVPVLVETKSQAVAPPLAPATIKTAPAVTATTTVQPSSGASHTPALVAGAGAIALLGGALVFDLWGDSIYSNAKSDPDPAKQLDYWHQANTRRYIAEGMLGAGVATAGVAVWLWLRADHSGPSSTDTALRGHRIAPVVAREHVGLELEGVW